MNTRFTSLLLIHLASFAIAAGADPPSPAAIWDFDSEASMPLVLQGGVERDQAGPRPPQFPDFAENNTAIRLAGNGAHVAVADPGLQSPFDFTTGDAITLEAWVRIEGSAGSSPMYVIGKGRTGGSHVARDNQNWALRVVQAKGVTRLSFLFATARGDDDSHWHRWTTQSGFDASTGWHHIAVAYRFGQSDSIRGWIDGQPTTGSWDMGGATAKPPVVDNDAVWIGSSQSGSAGNSFRGSIDQVAIYRAMLDDEFMAKRFRRVGGPRVVGPLPEVMPVLEDLPAGRVLVTVSAGMPTHERWLNEGETWPRETARWLGDEFLLPRIPLRYDEWGIRASWKSPLLVRMVADVELTAGTHSLLLRARSLSRLWVDGQLVARTTAITKQPPNGEEPMTPVATAPLPGVRLAGYHQQEVIAEASIEEYAGGEPRLCRVVLEMIVGGKGHRSETGEVTVAVLGKDRKSFHVLQPALARDDKTPSLQRDVKPKMVRAVLPLTDESIKPALARIEASLASHDEQTRRTAAASQDEFWHQRHEAARSWAQRQPAATVPSTGSTTGSHPIDRFLADRIEKAKADAEQFDQQTTENFHGKVLPILREQCFRCHGEKNKGGLKLDSRASALNSGDSEVPAIVPGSPDASEMIARIRSHEMPPTENGLSTEQIAILENWVQEGALWPSPPINEGDMVMAPMISDETFLRRIYLDTVGVPPTAGEARSFLDDTDDNARERLIDRLLVDPRCADHGMSDWLDMLAENPTLLNQSLNSTGPFRWFIHDSLRDKKPLDRMVTELILMRGSPHEGGSAGFSMAAENDVPFAAKGHILASAFLGIELQCARCHDSPYHSTTQRDLFSLAAMLERKPVAVPETSRVPAEFFQQQQRESLIRVTLKADESVAPLWPFAEITGVADDADIGRLMQKPDDSRERLAALITSPQNRRFSQVYVNRLWKRLVGAGFVEPAHDWEGRQASHPELLQWLADQFITHDYDVDHIVRLIVTSQAYQREAIGHNLTASHQQRFFTAPDRRRLTAEQIVDSLYVATGSKMDVSELTFVHDGRRDISNRLTLGYPSRAWMFASLNNERDRPSLSLPKARAVADVLVAFGWNGSRQQPIHQRDNQPNVLQSGVLANGTLANSLTRAGNESELAQLAVDAKSPEALVEAIFLRVLTRLPKPQERSVFVPALSEGFDKRIVASKDMDMPKTLSPLPLVTWFNHLQSEANTIQQEVERRVRQGPAPDPRLRSQWREVYDDVVWSLVNHREFVWMP